MSLEFESKLLREEIRNELIINPKYSEKPGAWVYDGKWYHSQFDLYMIILAHKTAEQLGISDILGLIAIFTGAPIIPTRVKFGGSIKGTSIASKYLSQIPGKTPFRVPTLIGYPKIIGGAGIRMRLTSVIGRIIGRATPFIGWGVLAYDITKILYNTYIEFNHITNEE